MAREIDHQRQRGALRQVVIPPCPEELVRLREALQASEPDLTEVARIASSDVAMAAVLLRNANS
ncbi:MAG: HDOD domain-containing protein, partial [Rubrivivax sp.]